MALRLDGTNPLSYMGVRPTQPPQLVIKKEVPTSKDGTSFELGTLWVIPKATFGPSEEVWILVGKESNISTWVQLDPGAITFPLSVSEGGTGQSTLTQNSVLVGNGTSPISQILGTTNTVLLGNTGASPSFGQVPNAALQNSTITLSNGNNIAVTGSPVSLGGTATIAVAGTTNHALQLGNASGSLTSMAVGTNGQIPVGSTGADPSWVTPTAGTGLTVTANATTHQYALTIPVVVSNGGTGATILTNHGVLLGQGTSAIAATAVGTTNTVLLGNTGADPSFGTVPNAALQNSTITLSGGNNVTVTGSPISLGGTATVAVTGTTNNAIQVGNASGSLTSLAVGTDGQVMIGSTGANPSFVTPTAGNGLAVTANATTLEYALTAPVTVQNGGTGNTSLTAYAVLCGGTTSTSPVQALASLGTAGQILTSNGAGALPSFQNLGNILVETIYTTGSGTHTLNTKTQFVKIAGWGGGGGGGSGRRGASGGSSGGGGGAGSCFGEYFAPVSFFGGAGASVSYAVGAGGTGGAAQTVNATNGNPGSTGGSTRFGSFYIRGGIGGNGGTNANGTATSMAGRLTSNILGRGYITPTSSSGGAGRTGVGLSGVDNQGCSAAAGGAGGAGGLNAGTNAGAAGADIFDNQETPVLIVAGGTAGSAPGGAGGAGNNASATFFSGGSGGGSGGGGTSVIAGGTGGNGGFPGGGAGGGGGSVNGANSGAGGTGGSGALYIWELL